MVNKPRGPGRSTVARGTKVSADSTTSGLLRLPFELKQIVSEFLLEPRQGRHKFDLDSLPKLSRTCSAARVAFQPLLFRNLHFPRQDRTRDVSDTAVKTGFAGAISCLLQRLDLLKQVRSIDFTHPLTVSDTATLPDCYDTFVENHIKGWLWWWSDLGKYKVRKLEASEASGYPIQLTVLLLSAQENLVTALFSMSKVFWAHKRNKKWSKGLRLYGIPDFPRLAYLTLKYYPGELLSDRLPGRESTGKGELQGNHDLLLQAAPNLKTLILRGCNLSELPSTIPAHITSLVLHDCFYRASNNVQIIPVLPLFSPIEGSALLKSLCISFKPSIANQYPDHIDIYYQCHADGKLSTWPEQQPLEKPPKELAKISNRDSEYNNFSDASCPCCVFHGDIMITTEGLRAFWEMPQPYCSSIGHLEIDLRDIPPYDWSRLTENNISEVDLQFSYDRGATAGQIIFPLILGGHRGPAGKGAFPNLKTLTIHCGVIILPERGPRDHGQEFHYRYRHRCHDDYARSHSLISLVRAFSPGIENLELTGVEMTLAGLIDLRWNPNEAPGRSPFLDFATAIAIRDQKASPSALSNLPTPVTSTTDSNTTESAVVPALSRLKRVTLYTDRDPRSTGVIRMIQEPLALASLFKQGNVELILLVRREG